MMFKAQSYRVLCELMHLVREKQRVQEEVGTFYPME